ncbi:probable glutamate receptor [Macrobrachium nipponense]|uniref:probable glutamate receptor n=1 Tax=Macrobrachium nipponense TaxID=159736 RepID=UPI0030C7BEE6
MVGIFEGGSTENNLWTLRMMSYLAISPSAKLRVLPAEKIQLLEFQNSTSVDALNITKEGKEGRMVDEGRTMPLKIEIDPQSGTTLTVCRLRTANELRVFRRVFAENKNVGSWLLLADVEQLQQRLNEVYLPMDNQIVLATYTKDGKIVNFWESFQVTENLPQSRQIIGQWWRKEALPETWRHEQSFQSRFNEGLEWHRKQKAPPTNANSKLKVLKFGAITLSLPSEERMKRRRDLSGLHLACVTIQSYPLTILHHQRDGSMRASGVLHSLMETLATLLNFTCHEVADKQWGAFSNGDWTGMIGEVLYGKADIAVAPLDITLLRSQAVDFIMPLVDSRYKMIMKRPNAQDVVWTAYTRPFPAVIWSCVVAMAAVMTVLLFLAKESKDRRCHFSILDAFTAIVRYGCGQGNDLQLRHTSERLVAFLAQMFFKFLGAFYTSFLVSSLAAGLPDPKLVSLQDVLQASMTLGLVEGTAPVEYFKDSPNHLHQKVWQSLQRNNYAAISQDLETAMRRTRSEPYVLMEWEMHLKFKYEADCQSFILPTSYFQSKSSIALKKGSPYAPLLNSAILEMLESGFLVKWWREKKQPRPDNCRVEIQPVEFETITSLMTLLMAAILTSILFMPLEMLWSHCFAKVIRKRGMSKTNLC